LGCEAAAKSGIDRKSAQTGKLEAILLPDREQAEWAGKCHLFWHDAAGKIWQHRPDIHGR